MVSKATDPVTAMRPIRAQDTHLSIAASPEGESRLGRRAQSLSGSLKGAEAASAETVKLPGRSPG